MSVAVRITALLEAQGFGTIAGTSASGWSLNTGEEPEKPSNTITVYDTGGPGPETDEMDFERRTVQIRIRAARRAQAVEQGEAVRAYLLTKPAKTSGDRVFVAFQVNQDLAEIGKDELNRPIFTLNLTTLSYKETTP